MARGFARLARGGGRTITMSHERVGLVNPQLGYFDRTILCAECDNKLGAYDDYAVELCRTFPTRHNRIKRQLFEMPDVDCAKVAIFVLSVLWRASISAREEHRTVALGSLEERTRAVIFDALPLSALPQFKLVVFRLESDHLDVSRFYTMPQRWRFRGLNVYGFSLNGFRFIAFMDARPLPGGLESSLVREDGVLRGPFVTFEEGGEFKQLVEMADPIKRVVRRLRV